MSFCQIFILVQLKTVFTKTFDDFGFGEFNCRGLTQLVMPIDTGINFGLKRPIHVEAKKEGTYLKHLHVSLYYNIRYIIYHSSISLDHYKMIPSQKLDKKSAGNAAAYTCSTSSYYATLRSGGFTFIGREPRDCLIYHGGDCSRGGSCESFCGNNGYCCARNGRDFNEDCPQGNLNLSWFSN